MSTVGSRLKEERERLGLSQPALGDIGGVKKLAQINYEKGERAPDTNYLEAIAQAGANVQYIVTGEREGPAPEVLTADERELLALFRAAPLAVKAAAIGALQGGTGPSKTKVKKQVNVSASGGQAAGRNIVNKGGKG